MKVIIITTKEEVPSEPPVEWAVKTTVHPEDGEIWVDNIFDLAPFKEYEEVKVIILKKDE